VVEIHRVFIFVGEISEQLIAPESVTATLAYNCDIKIV